MSMEHKCLCRGDEASTLDLEKPTHLMPMMRPFSMSFNKMPLQIAKPAPQFKTTAVANGEFKDIALSDFKGKYVVLFFYPLDLNKLRLAHANCGWVTAHAKLTGGPDVGKPTPRPCWLSNCVPRLASNKGSKNTFVCPTEIIAFSERADDFRKIGCEVLAASTDSHFTHLAWINTPRKQGGLGPMNIPILSDKSHSIARDYGVLNEETGIPFRGLFIIDDKQNLRQITVNDLPVGRSVEETLRLVQAFQFTDKHGEVCPANWQPGAKTIKPDTKAAQEYFVDAN
ncbi:peroxiredoxin 1 isoform X1 [Manduca sexta]|uniref:peroxiredoxin 1 isoform X1 n=1 Tax=Manduca sexta TaxID=7130 RepID=UPI0018905C66|nr:peroxiredoxin 1 isoform X1 [Manduca sexta]